MLIKSVNLHNIRSYLSQEVEFPHGTVLLSGDIGSGKSTILLAIEFALFGISKGLFSGEALLRHGKQQGYVELGFSIDGKEVIVRRNLRRLKDSVKQEEGWLVIDGVKQFCTAEELRARILGLLGYPHELLRKSKGLIYRFTVYTPQEEMKRILFEDPQGRLDTLRRVFQIEKYKLVREAVGIVLQGIREKRRELSARVEGLPGKQQQLQGLSGELAAVEARLAPVAPALADVELALQRGQAGLSLLQEKARKLFRLKSSLAALAAVVGERKGLIDSKNSELLALMDELARLRSGSIETSSALAALSASLSSLSSLSRRLLSEAGSRAALEIEIENAEKLRSEAEAGISRCEALKASSWQLKQKVASLSSCPTCLQPVSDGHKHAIAREEDARMVEIDRQLSGFLAGRSAASERVKVLKSQISALLARERTSVSLDSELKHFFDLAAFFGIKIEQEAAPALEVDVQAGLGALYRLQKQLGTAREGRVMAIEKERAIGIAEKSIQAAKEELLAVEVKLSALSGEIGDFGDVEGEIARVQPEIDWAILERMRLSAQKAGLDKEREGIVKMLALLSGEIGIMESARKELEAAGNMGFWLEEMFLKIVGVIERQVMMTVHQEFDALFREWFLMLMGNDTLSARVDDDFTPVVEADGFEIPIENLSGGEKTSCALAYRLALNAVINNLVSTIRTRDILILDEPTDGFSSEQLNKLRDVLAQLRLPQVILVSHEDRIESFVQRVIRVQKEQHVSRVVG